jgi:serine phosphatase RsbU (regulator of sigma subunit)/catechol 2,3-dioxygenase-like lactoylglutathione lyase family enzyme
MLDQTPVPRHHSLPTVHSSRVTSNNAGRSLLPFCLSPPRSFSHLLGLHCWPLHFAIISPMSSTSALYMPDRSSPLSRREQYLRVHCINIFVRDQERSLRFYRDQLGFQVAFDVRLQSGDRWVAVAPPDGTAILALVAPKPTSPECKLIGRSTQVVFVTEDVAAKFQEWSKRGVRFSQTPRLRRLKYEHPDQEIHPERGTNAERETPSGVPSMLLGGETPIWGSVFARFRDVDGNSFSLVSFDEVTHALEAQRRAMAEKLELERRAAQELEIAKQVQSRLFPQTLPPLKTLNYAGTCIQARAVGGDYYDFLSLGQDRLGFVIGDIAGKGIAAALLMANLQANLRSQCAIALDQPQRFLQSVNQLFCENTTDGAYATLFFAEYDDRSQTLRYVNCGHLPALVFRRDNTLEHLDSTCTVLGIFKNWDCAIGERQLFPGDLLALYTDGITESFNDAREEFGEERLVKALRRRRDWSPRDILASVVEEVQQFSPHEQHDDITLIVAKCPEP